jgi:hypothetical protein
METCAATARGLQPCSPINPSLSAEDCTARRDFQLLWSGALQERKEWRSVPERRDDDGEEQQNHPTD